MNYYKKAPTWLVNQEGESKLFNTQKEVDRAWEEGWYGPRGLMDNIKYVSEKTYETKNDIRRALALDPRYLPLNLNYKKSIRELMADVVKFEEEQLMGD